MAAIKEHIAANIASLRKNSGMSQAELAEKLHYTDKAISKWERGESTPDVDSLDEISKIFNVSIEYLFEEHDETSAGQVQTKASKFKKRIAILSLLITGIWTICVIAFVYGYTTPNVPRRETYFLALIWAIPLSFLLCVIFGFKYKLSIWLCVFGSLLLWTLLVAISWTVFMFNYNVWYMLTIGIPLQAAIIIGYFLFINK